MKEDWTAISDIGKVFNGKELTIESYKKTEDSYISVIRLIMEYLNVPYLTVTDVIRSFPLEMFKNLISDYHELYSKEMIEYYSSEKNNDTLEKEYIDVFCRLLLREDIGSKIFYNRKMKIFIGYDYLMSIHTSKSLDSMISLIEELGLYVEDFSK
ncbi:hypothetical protein [Rummeliibacillus pycnus]|uniref:hypothetical protein n=1 Tax=Rummeliibacillus pycnus TaxID=101070 RepID=UPI003D2B9CB8